MVKGHEAQGIHTQAILSQISALGSRRNFPSPWPSLRGSLQLPPQGSRWSSLFRPILATPVHTLCSGLTGLVCNPLPLPTGLW